MPPFLAVIDTEKAALMKAPTCRCPRPRNRRSGASPPASTRKALGHHQPTSAPICVVQNFHPRRRFIATVKAAIKSGDIIRTQITPDNLKQVFDKWVDMIGAEISGVAKKTTPCCSSRTSCTTAPSPPTPTCPPNCCTKQCARVQPGRQNFELGNKEGYRQFWAIYHRRPKRVPRLPAGAPRQPHPAG